MIFDTKITPQDGYVSDVRAAMPGGLANVLSAAMTK